MLRAPCPKNSFVYNKTFCSCNPGFLLNTTAKSCCFYSISESERWDNSSVKQSIVDAEYKKALKYQTYYVEISIAALLMWLILCSIVRFGKLRDGRNAWFQIRWWISRLDFTFSTHHWLADQTVVRKRKTELGGTVTIASWILFIGLLVSLLYQIITTLGEEEYNMRPTNAPDFISFTNDLELNVTTISSMTCSQLRGPKTIVIGSPGSIDYTIVPLSNYAKYSCHNSSKGPILTLKCQDCPLTNEHMYISWHFFDIKNKVPATAVGFLFNFTVKNHVGEKEYANFISGTIKNGGKLEDKSVTYRGADTQVLKFNLFPRIHLNLKGLKLLQPSFHHFQPGSFAGDQQKLQSLLYSSKDGLVNTTLALHFQSEYMIMVDKKRYTGPVTFLADVGGLYCLSITLFLLLLALCEMRIKRLRTEDHVMQNIRKQRNAEDRWHKLRRYVAYTYGCRLLDERYNVNEAPTCCFIRRNGLSTHQTMKKEIDIQSFGLKKHPQPSREKVLRDATRVRKGVQTLSYGSSNQQFNDQLILPPPSLPAETKYDSPIDLLVLQRELRDMYEYNAMLKDRLISAETKVTELKAQTTSTSGS